MERKIDPKLYKQFQFLHELIPEKEFKEYGAEVEQGFRGDGTVYISFGCIDPRHGHEVNVSIDETGEVTSIRNGGRIKDGGGRKFPREEVRKFISSLFTEFEFRRELAKVPKGHPFDVNREDGNSLPDGKVMNLDLWELAAKQDKSIQEVAREVEAKLIEEGWMVPKDKTSKKTSK